MVEDGFIEIDWVVCPPGDHTYVPPTVEGVAVSIVELPEHTVCELTETEVDAEDVIVTEVVSEHPIWEVAIMLYTPAQSPVAVADVCPIGLNKASYQTYV